MILNCKHRLIKRTSLGMFFVFTFQLVGTIVAAEIEIQKPQRPENIYAYMAKLHLPTLANQEAKEIERNKEVKLANEELRKSKYSIGNAVQIPALGEVEKLRHAYLIFGAQGNPASQSKFDRLDESTLSDLEIVSGQRSKLQRHLIALLEPYLHTAIGKVQLQKMLCEPLTNFKELGARQENIKKLIAKPEALKQLEKKLQGLRTTENEFLWFWKGMEGDDFDQLEANAVLGPINLSPKSIRGKAEKDLPISTEASTRFMLAYKTVINPFIGIPLWFALYVCRHGWQASMDDFDYARQGIINLWGQLSAEDKAAIKVGGAIYGTIFGLIFASLAYDHIKTVADYKAASKVILAKMNSVAKFARIGEELLGSNALGRDVEKTATLMQLFNSSTLKSDPSFFSYNGRGVAALLLMAELKDHFVHMLEELGKLDAYVAIASFMQAQEKNKNGKYCFPTYIEKDTPYLNLAGYWHPFLNHDSVVTNDIELGGSVARNIVVTGPNAGGKSTALKSITLALVMAQTLGIAPSNTMMLTPFKIINTYMNIADDAGSESLFQAEMHRAANLIKLVKNQTGKDFIFVVMDELFTGTNPLEGTSAAYGVIKKLITYPNSMLIFVTHFKELTELEQETNGQIKNFKVWVDRQNGSISYPYKMVPGISDQTIALELLALEGFDPEILSQSVAQLDRMKHAKHN